MEFSRQEYWRGLAFLPSGDLPDPGIEPMSLGSLPALAGGFFTNNATWKAHIYTLLCIKWITNKNLLYSTGNSTQYSVMAYTGKESLKKRVNICKRITDSLSFPPETNTTL